MRIGTEENSPMKTKTQSGSKSSAKNAKQVKIKDIPARKNPYGGVKASPTSPQRPDM